MIRLLLSSQRNPPGVLRVPVCSRLGAGCWVTMQVTQSMKDQNPLTGMHGGASSFKSSLKERSRVPVGMHTGHGDPALLGAGGGLNAPIAPGSSSEVPPLGWVLWGSCPLGMDEAICAG